MNQNLCHAASLLANPWEEDALKYSNRVFERWCIQRQNIYFAFPLMLLHLPCLSWEKRLEFLGWMKTSTISVIFCRNMFGFCARLTLQKSCQTFTTTRVTYPNEIRATPGNVSTWRHPTKRQKAVPGTAVQICSDTSKSQAAVVLCMSTAFCQSYMNIIKMDVS